MHADAVMLQLHPLSLYTLLVLLKHSTRCYPSLSHRCSSSFLTGHPSVLQLINLDSMDNSASAALQQKVVMGAEEVAAAAAGARRKRAGAAAAERKPRPAAERSLRCPRCDATNTKFCYYNNYSLSQPRYFCKDCRRYWTQGGTLRNVPVGGATRKNHHRKTIAAAAAKHPHPQPRLAYPNVLPTFVSTGFQLPRDATLAAPPPSPSPSPALPPAARARLLSLLRATGGGQLVDGMQLQSSNLQQYDHAAAGAATAGNGMPPMQQAFAHNLMLQQQHGLGVNGGGAMDAAGQLGGGGVKLMQWPPQQEGTVSMMDVDNGSAAAAAAGNCYWNNGAAAAGGTANPNPNPWQGLTSLM